MARLGACAPFGLWQGWWRLLSARGVALNQSLAVAALLERTTVANLGTEEQCVGRSKNPPVPSWPACLAPGTLGSLPEVPWSLGGSIPSQIWCQPRIPRVFRLVFMRAKLLWPTRSLTLLH